MTTKEYLIKTTFDDAGMNQFKQDADNARKAAEQLGLSFAQTAKIIDQSVNVSLNKAGATVKTVTSIFEENGQKARVSFTQMGESISNVSGSMQTAGTVAGSFSGEISKLTSRALLVVPVWLALRAAMTSLIGVFQESIQFMVEWETEMAKVRAITGATQPQLDTLSNSLLAVSEKFGISNKEVADSTNQWLRMGASLNTVTPLLEATSKLSLVSGQSMADSAKNLNSIISAFGLSSGQASGAVDKLISVEEKSGVSLEVLTSGFAKAGLTAKAMGLSFDQLAGYIVAVNQQSRQSGDLIGTQLRSMFIRLGSTAIDTAQAISKVPFFLNQVGEATTTHTPTLRNMNDIVKDLATSWGTLSNAQQDALAKTLGGNLRSTAVIALLSNFNSAIKASKESADSAVDSGKVIGDLTDTVAAKVTKLQTSWGSFLTTVNASGIMKTFLDSVNTRVQILTNSANSLKAIFDVLFNPKGLEKHLEEADFKNIEAKNPRNQIKGQTNVSSDETEGQQTYNTSLLTTMQIKQGIQHIEENATSTREDALITVQKELDILARADGQAHIALLTEINSLNIKKEKLELERQIADAQERETTVLAQMKAEGASTLQLDIQRLAFLQATHATVEEISKQQTKVNIDAIDQNKQIKDEILNTVIGEQQALGATKIQQIENKIILENQLGIHLQGIDLLKQQLELYKAITDQAKKSRQEKDQELETLIRKTPVQNPFRQAGNEFQATLRESRLRQQASQRGISDQTVENILNPGKNRFSGGVNSLQENLKRALTDPLSTNISGLSGAINKLSDTIENHTRTGLTNEVPRLNLTVPTQSVPLARQTGPGGFSSFTPTQTTVSIGGINVTVSGNSPKEISEKVAKMTQDIVAAHLLKPGTKINNAAKNVIENY